MSAEPRERPHDQWHAALRAEDRTAHSAEDARMVSDAVAALETRLAQANGDRHALTAAVLLRDQIVADLSQALVERDGLVARLEGDLRHLQVLAAQPVHRRVARRVRREISRLVGRRA